MQKRLLCARPHTPICILMVSFASSTLYPQRSTRQQSVPGSGWHTCLTTRQVSARPMAPSASLYFCSHIYLHERTYMSRYPAARHRRRHSVQDLKHGRGVVRAQAQLHVHMHTYMSAVHGDE